MRLVSGVNGGDLSTLVEMTRKGDGRDDKRDLSMRFA